MEDTVVNPIWWLLWGAGIVVAYVVVSNTLYLLIGARILQFLPGVNVKGFRGTLRLALLLAVSVLASVWWISKASVQFIAGRGRTRWRDEVERGIRLAARIVNI